MAQISFIITLENNYQLDLTKSNINNLIGFNKVILRDEENIGTKTPNISEDTDVLNSSSYRVVTE